MDFTHNVGGMKKIYKFIGPFMQQPLIEEGVPQHETMVLTFGKVVILRTLLYQGIHKALIVAILPARSNIYPRSDSSEQSLTLELWAFTE